MPDIDWSKPLQVPSCGEWRDVDAVMRNVDGSVFGDSHGCIHVASNFQIGVYYPDSFRNKPETSEPLGVCDSDTLNEALSILRKQEAKGLSKYGATLDDFKGSESDILQHAIEEAADLLMYLITAKKRIMEAAKGGE
jgi:hypothetical protein